MQEVTGGSLPALAWGEYTAAALRGAPAAPLPGGSVALARDDSGLGKLIGRILDNLGARDRASTPEVVDAPRHRESNQNDERRARGVGN
jgi:hypothetical protein